MRRVVVTGIGVVAPNGVGRTSFWENCVNGVSGIGPIRSFDASKHPIRIAGEIHDFDPSPLVPTDVRKQLKLMARAAKFGLGAAALAVSDSGLNLPAENPERLGVAMGTGVVPVDLGELAPMLARSCDEQGFDATKLPNPGGGGLFPLWLLKHLPNMTAAHVSLAFNCQGPNTTLVTACVAGTQAVGEGFRMIARDEADVVLAGGADSRIDPLMLLAYTALGTLSKGERPASESSRPFDRLRDGFVISEGAAVLVLEEYERAKARGAEIFAEVMGFGSSFDAYSVTKPDPDGRGGARAIKLALNEAGVNADDIGYINAHGTSTRLNDQMETAAVKRVFGDHSKRVKLSSIKSMIGHSIGAAGAIEAAALALSLRNRVLPPTINLTHPDPACDLDYVPNSAQDGRPRVGLSTSFGFGGQNGALVMQAA
ncbi:MAG: beta-ketoacyl-[acyl-carrier-protein] synthase family protein [Fimbriiglobus sp.]|jgi:3-oxoacyl-[acyl-carrier-protein] synthase II|nr:beta-ketoacyl-[acyl-carrier-protein] synthase family protein [Fimbriiglobus sp.]